MVYVTVAALVIWSVVRYRRRNDELPTQTHGNNRLELTWTAIPFVIVLFLFAATLQAQDKVLDRAAQPAVNVTVTGFQWSRLRLRRHRRRGHRHPGPDPGDGRPGRPAGRVRLPVGRRGALLLRAPDLFKRQAIPGVTSEFDLTFEKVGLYHGACVQFCGLQHGHGVRRARGQSG